MTSVKIASWLKNKSDDLENWIDCPGIRCTVISVVDFRLGEEGRQLPVKTIGYCVAITISFAFWILFIIVFFFYLRKLLNEENTLQAKYSRNNRKNKKKLPLGTRK